MIREQANKKGRKRRCSDNSFPSLSYEDESECENECDGNTFCAVSSSELKQTLFTDDPISKENAPARPRSYEYRIFHTFSPTR